MHRIGSYIHSEFVVLLGTSIVIQDILHFKTITYLSRLLLTVQDYLSRQLAFLNSAFAQCTVFTRTSKHMLLSSIVPSYVVAPVVDCIHIHWYQNSHVSF